MKQVWKIGRLAAAVVISSLVLGALALPPAMAEDQKAKEMFNEGLEAAKKGDKATAVAAYSGAIQVDPNYVDAYLNLGAIHFADKKYDDALKMYKAATERDKKNGDAFANLGRVEFYLKKYVEAEAALKTALSLKPGDLSVQRDLVRVHDKKNSFDEVIKLTTALHAGGNEDGDSWFFLGRAHYKKDNSAEAIKALSKSVSLDAGNYSAHFTLGQIHLGQEKYAEAATAFKAASKADPKKHMAAYNYAVATESMKQDDVKNNVAVWETFVRTFKNDPRAKTEVATAEAHVKALKESLAAKTE